MDFLKNLSFNIALFLVGALFVLLGITSGFTFNNFSFTVQDIWSKIISIIVGVLLAIAAIFLEIKRNPQKEITKKPSTDTGLNDKASKKTQVRADDFFHTRESASTPSFASMLEECEELLVTGKDCHGLLTTHFDQIQKAVISRKKVRFLIVNHSNKSLLNTMSASSITRPESKQRTETAKEALKILRRLITAIPDGDVKVKLANFLPTYTCTIFDGRKASGRMTVENYDYKISSGQRLRMYLTKEKDPQTFAYYVQQFDKMWDASELLNDNSS